LVGARAGLLHRQHVTSLLNTVRNATLMLCRKTGLFARKNLACFGNEAGELLNIVERKVHRIARAIDFFAVCAHEAKKKRY